MSFLTEVHYGMRVLSKNRGFTGIALSTLAVCIAANAAIFSMVDAIALRPYPFKDLNHIVGLSETIPKVSVERYAVSAGNFFDWKQQNHVFDRMEAYKPWGVTLTGTSEGEQVQGYLVSSGFFPLLGLPPLKGRVFAEQGDENEKNQVVVSHGFWQRRLGADRNVVGSHINLDGLGYTVVGVMPGEFDFPTNAEIWAPWVTTPADENERAKHELGVVARLKIGATVSQAQAEMNNIGQRLAREYPLSNTGRAVDVTLLREIADPYARRFMAVLMGAVAFLLLLACANVANLQLARGAVRRKEMALRIAIGAGRARIVGQLVTEGLLLALLGGVLGLPLAVWALSIIKGSMPQLVAEHVPSLMRAHPDVRMLGFAFAAAVLTGIASSLPVALQASPERLSEALKESGRGPVSSGRYRMRSVLVISEIGFAIVLLIGGGLMANGFRHLAALKQGFDPTHVLTFNSALRESQYGESYQVANFYKEMLRRLTAIREIRAAAVISELPALGDSRNSSIIIEGQVIGAPDRPLLAEVRVTSENYFRTMAIPIREGRAFTSYDTADNAPVALVSISAARRFWPRQDAVGRRLKLTSPDFNTPWLTVVGVVGDVNQFFLDSEVRPTVYVPYLQQPIRALAFVIRSEASFEPIAFEVRAAARSVDPAQRAYNLQSLSRFFAELSRAVGVMAALMGTFATIALALSAAGVYAVMAYSVVQRTQEIGIRMALGAAPKDIWKLVVRNALSLVGIGLAVGLPAALALSRVMAHVLSGVVALDPFVFVSFTSLLAMIALLASYIPARRATMVDPLVALRLD